MNWIFLCWVLLFAQADSLKIDSAPPTNAAPATSAGESSKTDPAPAKPASEAPPPTASTEAPPAEKAPGKEGQSSGWLNDLLHTGAMKYMIDGGIFMWPILFLGILALGVIIERFRALMMLNTRAEALRSKVRSLLENDEVEEALQLCDREQGPVPAILAAGLRKYVVARRLGYDAAKIEEQVVKGMDDYSIHIVAAMEKHLPILATVSSAAPMLGFLGTVEGMVFSFDEIVRMHGQQDIVLSAASGIMVSLLTTVLGLLVGLPAFIAFNYFSSAINEFVLDVEESAAELIEAVTLQLALGGSNGHAQAPVAARETPVAK